MNHPASKCFSLPPLFDPEEGVTVIEPLQGGAGWWAGACSALYDEEVRQFYLYYRLRRPREQGRGTDAYVARSEDGVKFEPIWHARKEDFHSDSVERGALLKAPNGEWRLYLSYVDPADSRWRTDVMVAMTPDGFDPVGRVPVFRAADISAEGVKDPVVYLFGGLYYALFSYAPSPRIVTEKVREMMHATADVYNTGIVKSHTGLAVSGDGVHFAWKGDLFAPRESGWDAYAARIGCLLYRPPVFLAFYDGSASVEENYEEKTGLAVSFDLRHFERVSTDGPLLTAPHGSGSLRYLDAILVGTNIYYYYEYARPDGSHELRMSRVSGA